MCCPGLDIENGVETRTLQALAFDVVLRDFSVEHPDFENFSEEYVSTDGFSMVQNPFLPPYLQVASATGKALEYGQCADGYDRNFVNANLTEYVGKAGCAKGDWSNPVYYTPGMVQKNFVFAPTPDGRLDMFDGVFIQKANDLCDNSNFHQWYSA